MSIHNLAGQTLGQYELRELLGAGGMGAVYRAYQPGLQRAVAVKVLSPSLAEQAGYIERFTREARTAAALEHAHIVPVYDYGTQRDISYVVMRLLPGGALSERLEQRVGSDKPLPSLGETAELLKQVASALDYAHSQGVIHRDIKPSNIMFDSQGGAYLVDFGIAKLAEATSQLTGSGVAMGTPSYMAPEQWRAEQIGPATDQYALGAMIYTLVTGKVPFEAPTPYALMHKHLNEMPTPPHVMRPDVPHEIALVLERAMAKRPQDRFPTCTAFAQAFDSAVRGKTGEQTAYFTSPVMRKPPRPVTTPAGTLPPPAALPPTATQPIYRHPAMWAMGVVLLILLAAVIFLLAGSGGDDEKSPAQSENPAVVAQASATETAGALVILSTDTPEPTDNPTHTPEPSRTPEPTPAPTDTAAPPSDTPTLSSTEIESTIQAEMDALLTLTATQWTPTPSITPTPTIDVQATAQARLAITQTQFADNLTLTASAWTYTPSPTPAPTRTSITMMLTQQAADLFMTHTKIVSDLTATADARTPTYEPTATPGATAAPPPATTPSSLMPAQAWSQSGHAAATDEPFIHWNEESPPEIPAACAKCHSQDGYLDWIGADGTTASWIEGPVAIGSVITCEVCHNPVAESRDSVVFPSGIGLTGLGDAANCIECHQGRASGSILDSRTEGLDDDTPSDELTFINIHYYAAAVSLFGADAAGGYEYAGQNYQPRLAHVAEFDTCTECHDPHSLEVRLAACATCHTETATGGPQAIPASRDEDGDGSLESLHDELEGLQAGLYSMMVAYARDVVGVAIVYNPTIYPYFFNDLNINGSADSEELVSDNRYVSFTPRLLRAAYNFQAYQKDPGAFAHNGRYHAQLMYDSIASLNAAFARPLDLSYLHRAEIISSPTMPVELTPIAATPGEAFFPTGSSNTTWTPVIGQFDGVEMMLVPAGCFMMSGSDNVPAHEECFETPFWIDRTEVTNAQVAALGFQTGTPSTGTEPNRPIDSVTWGEAMAICALRGSRLPTDAEWEYAASGPESWLFPWGNEYIEGNAIFGSSGGQTKSVGSRPGGASWVGALDMAGNLSEWVSDVYGNSTGRTLRGGAWWFSDPYILENDQRDMLGYDQANNIVGFRCARDY
jgi:serine/threonine protein kinase/formylglycine-generating enzyme required for sulfatase activity